MSEQRGGEKDGSDGGGQAIYGLRLLGLAEFDGIDQAPPDWEPWTVTRIVEPGAELEGDEMMLWDDQALVPLPGLGRITVSRSRREIVFSTNRSLSDRVVLHPGLVPAAAVINWWQGRACIHASAVIAEGRAWALLADRHGGKSTTAALLARRDYRLFTDDMLIVEGTRGFAGPPSVDLRSDASRELGGTPLGVIGQRERWRKSLPGGDAQAMLGGLIELVWTDGAATIEELDLSQRFELAQESASMPLTGEQILALASLPAWRLARPRGLETADAGVELLVKTIGKP